MKQPLVYTLLIILLTWLNGEHHMYAAHHAIKSPEQSSSPSWFDTPSLKLRSTQGSSKISTSPQTENQSLTLESKKASQEEIKRNFLHPTVRGGASRRRASNHNTGKRTRRNQRSFLHPTVRGEVRVDRRASNHNTGKRTRRNQRSFLNPTVRGEVRVDRRASNHNTRNRKPISFAIFFTSSITSSITTNSIAYRFFR